MRGVHPFVVGLGAASVVLTVLSSPVPVAAAEHRAAWLQRARWGVMVHYLADWIWETEADQKGLTGDARREIRSIENWNALVDGFDAEGLAQQLKDSGASYLLLSIGQNSGYFLAPNATYDRIVGQQPSHCSRRDLVNDMADALAKRGLRLMVYLPSGAPSQDEKARTALEWSQGAHPNREFQTKWEAVIADWSKRWGKKVSGWWFDGCYWPNHMYRGAAPNFETFAAAARAGNPDSIVAFNPGVYYAVLPMTPHQDFIAGEVSDPREDVVKEGRLTSENERYTGLMDGVQLHMLSFLGETWGHPGPRGRRDPNGEVRFGEDEVVNLTLKVVAYGGAVTWDVPVERGGTISRSFMGRLRQLGRVMATMGGTFVANPAPVPAAAPPRGR
jgi:alpha-L-fucosidase